MKKICQKCGKLKPIEEFHKKKASPDGHRNQCKTCVEQYMEKYRKEHKEERAEYDKKRYDENREQILEHKKQYHQDNRETILKKKKIYRNDPENEKRIKEYLSKYREEHREEARLYAILYRKNNDDKIQEWIRNNPDKRMNSVINYYKRNRHVLAWRSLLRNTIYRLGTKKSSKTITLLKYSADEFKEHIESLFTTGMTWKNYGKWHVDHYIPVTAFKPDTPPHVVCSFKNIRPLWALETEIDGILYEGNLNKSNKLPKDIDEYFMPFIKDKIKNT